jgi:hypothetical protein
VKEYVVQSGPLRTLETIYDPRFSALKAVGEYHTILITAKPVTRRLHINALSRSSTREIVFIASLFSDLAQGARTLFGMRDITMGKAGALAKKLWDQSALNWHKGIYGLSEDELVFLELKDFAGDFDVLRDHVPPSEGLLFSYLTAAPFDVFRIYWERACAASLKSKDDRIRRDVLAMGHEAKVTLWQEPDGSFGVMLHPKIVDVEAVEAKITAAGQKAGMDITFAPGLFS